VIVVLFGEGAHNHTTVWCLGSSSIPFGPNYGEMRTDIQRSPRLPESQYFLNSALYEYCIRNANSLDFSLQMAVTGNEYMGTGWLSAIPMTLNFSDFELEPIKIWNEAVNIFNQYPEASGTSAGKKSNISTPRRYRFWTGVSGPWYLKKWVTHHAITASVNGTITGSAGGSVDLKLIRLSDYAQLMSTTRTGNGAFSMSWYGSDSNNYMVVATESAACRGVSPAGTPGTNTFDIILSSSGGTSGSGSISIVASNYAFIG
jgi:hypothetical protein